MRIAVMDLADARWTAGGTFTEVVVRSLRLAGGSDIDLTLFSKQGQKRWDDLGKVVSPPERFPWENRLRQGIQLPSVFERFCDKRGIAALMLAQYTWPGPTKCKRIVWLADFQHMHMPQLFSKRELRIRERGDASLIRRADRIMLSSEAVQQDLARFYANSVSKTTVLRFPSLFAFSPPQNDAGFAPKFYRIPQKFVLVANQFWAHKNHMAVIKAVASLKLRGISIPLVLTGLPADYRDPANSTVSEVLQAIAQEGLSGQVIPLGLIPRANMIDLLRCATVVVQPSRFEGWSTVVQDARALGRPVVCSDIPVHREQAPDALGFFDCDDPEALASTLVRIWPDLPPGPVPKREQTALEEHRVAAAAYASQLLKLCGST